MWVYSPLENTIPLQWDRKNYPIRKGINEIPEAIAQAYFLYALPDFLAGDEEQYKLAQRVALMRWGWCMNTKPPENEHLLQFILADTREELEESLTQPEPKVDKLVKK